MRASFLPGHRTVEERIADVSMHRIDLSGGVVLERGCVGLYDIVIAPAMRGRGLGRALVCGLLHWGRTQGAQWAELQVRTPNRVARGLYESLGFHPLYAYHYRLPAAAP